MNRRSLNIGILIFFSFLKISMGEESGHLFETGHPSLESFATWAIGYGAVMPDREHVAAYVSGMDGQFIHLGSKTEISIASSVGDSIFVAGSVVEILPEADPRTKQAIVTIRIPKQRVPERTYANVKVELNSRRVLAVPSTAVLWKQGAPVVFKQNEKKGFDPIPVTIGQQTPTYTEIRSGLTAEDIILVQGVGEWAYKDEAGAEAE